jgi:UDP-glucose 4-epimerase
VQHSLLLSPATFPSSIDTVIHLASLNERDCLKYPSEAIRVNVDETRLILESSIAQQVKQFIYFSTAHIYGAPLQGSITEETPPLPVHPYAITHRAAEDYIVAATIKDQIQGTVLRLSNSFGAPVSPAVNRWTLLTNDLCRQAVECGRLVLHSNGCQFRDFICLEDVEEIIADMTGRATKHIIYNLGSGISMRVLDMADAIVRSAVSVLQEHISLQLPAGCIGTEEPALLFSVNRLKAEGYDFRNDVQGELTRLLQFCKENFSRH